MASKLVKRSLELIGGEVKTRVKDYTSNLSAFTRDAQEIKDVLVKGETNAADSFQKLKKTGITKRISDWFYGEEVEADSLSSNEDFDPGFTIGNSSDEHLKDGDKKQTSLTYDTMKDISSKQTGMMLKIGRRQTEQSVANTAEIISVVNNRSAEMITAMNNINTSLKGVNERLDTLIKLQKFGIEAEDERASSEGGVYDSNGNLSLMGIFKSAKNNVTSGMLGQFLDAAKNGIGPDVILNLAMDSILGKPLNSLGGKSVNEMGKQFNDMIGNVIQTSLSTVIQSDTFKRLFGSVTGFEADKDYGSLYNAKYDTKRAQFDNMTRHTIVKLMPELLIKLNENLSGRSYHINQSGALVEGPAKNMFQQTINESLAGVGNGISAPALKRIEAGMKKVFKEQIPQEDINAAGDALVTAFIFLSHRDGDIVVTRQSLRGDNTEAITDAVDFITSRDNSKSASYWAKVCQVILYQMAEGKMDSHMFIANINNGVGKLQHGAADHAQNSIYGYQAGRITKEAVKTAYINNNRNITDDETNQSQISRTNAVTFKDKYTSADYVRGIFGLLNRGINVKVAGKKGSNTYGRFTAADIMRDPFTNQVNNNDAAAQMLVQAITGNTDAIKDSMNETMGLLGSAETVANAVGAGGISGIFGKTRSLISTGSNFSTLATNLRSNKFLGELKAALKGDSADLKNRMGGYYDKAHGYYDKAVDNLPYGLTHDQRMIEAGQHLKGIGGNAVAHGKSLGSAIKQRFSETGIGQGLHRFANNQLYDYDSRRLKSAYGKIDNLSTAGMSDKDIDFINAIKDDINNQGWTGRDAGALSDEGAADYIRKQVGIINTINSRRTQVEGTPDIGAVRMAAPTTEHGAMYNLVKKGFSATTKILGALAKLAKSGLQDMYYGFGSAIQGMFGGPRKDIKTGKTTMHRGLIGDMTWGLGKLGYHYSSKVAGGIAKGVSGAIDAYRNGDSGRYNFEEDRYYTRSELKQLKRDEYIDKYGDDVISANYQHYDKDGNWHFKAETYGDGTKVAKEGTVVTKADLATNPVKALSKTVLNVVGKLGYFGGALTKAIGAVKKFVVSVTDKVKSAFRKTSFGKGFLEGFDKAKIAKQKKLDQKEEQSSWANRTMGKIMRTLTGEDKSPDSPLQAICDILGRIEINTKPKEETTGIDTQQNGDATDQTGNTTGELGSASAFDINVKGRNGSSEYEETGSSDDATYREKKEKKSGGILSKIKNTAVGQYVSGGMENMGKIVGGLSQGVMGILKVAMSVLTAMEGFQAIKELVQEIFTKGLKPLNQVFQQVYKMIKPVVKQLTGIVKEIASSLAQMLDGVLKTLMPLMKMISDAISTIFDTILKPVMEILDATLSACMVPITLALDAMKPALDIICNDLKIVSGVVQLGMGGVMGLLGAIGTGIGSVVGGIGKILRWLKAKSAGNKMIEVGAQVSEAASQMLENSKMLIKNGAQQLKEGIAGQLQVVKKLVTLEYLGNDEEEKQETVVDQERLNGVRLDNGANFGAGDVNNYNTWNYTYGSGNTMNQHTYGPTMNMSERGCGPVALADAYNRRNGGNMNPLTLASSMMGTGNYDPSRGTSVTSMMSTGNALGMNMRAGGVTARSLGSASPNNPITVLGSGSGFGTKRGNDHYLNVLGSDGHGNSYVSNPMTGRVGRTPTSQLALNSRLGLYGSGDMLPEEFGISDDSMDALQRLQKLSERFTKIFTGDSTTDKIQKQVKAGQEENQSNSLDAQLGELTDEEQAQINKIATEKAKEAFGAKRDGETDDEYNTRFEKWFETNKTKYINYAKNQIIAARLEQQKSDFDSNTSSLLSKFNNLESKLGDMVNAAYDTNGLDSEDENGSSISSFQGAVMSRFSPLRNKTTNITNGAKDSKSPVHDYFAATSTGVFSDDNSSYNSDEYEHLFTYSGGWYKKGASPNSEGEGSAGNDNEGIVMRYDWFRSNPTIRAITPGTVVYVSKNGGLAGDDPNGGYGNSVKWRDKAGMYHWYMGLDSIADGIDVGTNLAENQEVGNMGHTGILDAIGMNAYANYLNNGKSSEYEKKLGTMFRYIVTKTGGSQVGDQVNPLTYWQYQESDSTTLRGDDLDEQMFNYLVDVLGGNRKAAAGAAGVLMNEGLANANAPGSLEGIMSKDSSIKTKYGTRSALDSYTKDVLFPMYDRQGKPLNKDAYRASDGIYYPGLGMIQWTGARGKALFDLAESNNQSWTDLEPQLKLIASELNSGYSGLKSYLEGVDSVQDAADAWMTQYEGGSSGTDPTGVLAAGEIAKRRQSASDIWDKYGINSTTTVKASNPAGIDVNGRFISTMTNHGDGDASDFIKAVAMAFRGYVSSHPAASYSNSDIGAVTAPDGYTWEHFRPDCSGFMAAGMRKL